MFEFLWPWAFVLLGAPLVMWFLPRPRTANISAIRAPFAKRWRGLATESGTQRPFWSWRMLLLYAMWIALVTAVARPQWVGEAIELPNSGRDLMLGLDLSGSMRIEDMQIGNQLVSRIDAVKAIAADFTQRREGDRVGLILFGTQAYVQAPLTFDTQTVTQFIQESQLGFAGEDTAIGDALGLAVKRLRERPAESRVFILLTDGQDTASTVDPMEAAALAAQSQVKVYTIGISRNLGRQSFSGGEVDEALLQAMAEATGGQYFRARDPQELQAIYARLDSLEPVEQLASTFRPRRALTWMPLSIALVAGLSLLAVINAPNRARKLRGGL
jgi:Ca-activated chloride channel family protein